MTYFRDPAKAAKLEEAIRLGFIIRQLGDDGVYTYALTQRGLMQWVHEKNNLK